MESAARFTEREKFRVMENDEITEKIIGCAIAVHRVLGPGLLESAYEECLAFELKAMRLKIERQVAVPVTYKEVYLDYGYRMDLLVENNVVVELKTVDAILPVHEAQILTYLRFSGKELGLLINFNVKLLKHGIRRFKM